MFRYLSSLTMVFHSLLIQSFFIIILTQITMKRFMRFMFYSFHYLTFCHWWCYIAFVVTFSVHLWLLFQVVVFFHYVLLNLFPTIASVFSHFPILLWAYLWYLLFCSFSFRRLSSLKIRLFILCRLLLCFPASPCVAHIFPSFSLSSAKT